MKEHEGHKIEFNCFHPFNFEKKEHVIEKSDNNGLKRRYLAGIASGLKVDGHGEKMTPNCINSFYNQANSGDVLLYADVHGIKSTQDIGKLVFQKILDNGDWYIECRLYDEADGVSQSVLETVETLWKQVNGFSPYEKPRQKGFSIEGIIPDNEIVTMKDDGSERVINDVLLDGIVVVPRPAYQASMANPIYKALGEIAPWQIEANERKIRKSIEDVFMIDTDMSYSIGRYAIEDCLYKAIETAFKDKDNKAKKIDTAFEIYKSKMIELVNKNENEIIENLSNDKVEECKKSDDEKQKWISDKIKKLVDEGKSQKQAVAIAYSMWEDKSKSKKSIGDAKNKIINELIMETSKLEKSINARRSS